MRKRRQLATAYVEKIFLLAPRTFRAVSCWWTSLTKVSKTLKMFRITRL